MQKKRGFLAALLMGLLVLIVVGCGKTQKPASQIYKNAEIIDMKGAAAPGKVSVVKISSKELSQADLEEWYYRYAKPAVAEHKYNYCVIAYTDKQDLGIIYNGTTLTKDISLERQMAAKGNPKCEGTVIVETDGGKYLKPLKFG